MKRFLLFAGTDVANANGVTGFVADFDSSAEALVLLVDQQKPCEWWHILDTQTGEVIERRQIRLSNGTIGFERSDRIVGTKAKTLPISAPARRGDDLNRLEADLQNVVTTGRRNGDDHANGHGIGATGEHSSLRPSFGGGLHSRVYGSSDAV
jgi:hypothetical protein